MAGTHKRTTPEIREGIVVKNAQLNFFMLVFDRYKLFALPYITAALHHNEHAVIEMITDNPRYFNKPKMDFLNRHFPGRVTIRPIPGKFGGWKNKKLLKSVRWLDIPKTQTPYVYIGDVDILILDRNIHLQHLNHANKINKPYSNMVRRNGINMTGLHFVIRDPYYKQINEKYLNGIVQRLRTKKVNLKSLDERLLCRIVKEKLGLPKGNDFRPVHGIHLSLHHPIIKWASTGVCPPAFTKLVQTPAWSEGIRTVFDNRFKKVISTFQNHALKLGREDQALATKILSGKFSKDEVQKFINRRQDIRTVKISLQGE